MKSTNPVLSSFWVKVCPIIIMFLSLGLSSTQAQNYKPFDEAVAAVQDAIVALKADPAVATPIVVNTSLPGAAAKSDNTQLKVFEISYFGVFIDKAKQTGSIAEAVQALDAVINSQGQPPSRVTIINAGRGDLMDLIAY